MFCYLREQAAFLCLVPIDFCSVMTDCKFLVNSEVCHPRFVFKLYGEVDSVKNTAMNIWLNDGVYWQCKNYMFRLIAAIFRF